MSDEEKIRTMRIRLSEARALLHAIGEAGLLLGLQSEAFTKARLWAEYFDEIKSALYGPTEAERAR